MGGGQRVEGRVQYQEAAKRPLCVCACVHGAQRNLQCVAGRRLQECRSPSTAWSLQAAEPELQDVSLRHFFLLFPPVWTHLLLHAWTTLR